MDDINVTTISSSFTSSIETVDGYFIPPATSTAIIKSTFLVLISVIGIVGNVSVIVLLSRQNRLPLVTYYFFLNLAIADLLSSVVCSPVFAVLEATQYFWPFGEALCKIVPFLQTVVIAASSFATVTISIERYFAATRPLKYRLSSNIRTKLMIISVNWLAAVCYALPSIFVSEIESILGPNGEFITCSNSQSYPNNLIYFVSGGIIIYVCPMMIIAVCYWKMLVAIKRATSNSNKNKEEVYRSWSVQKQTLLTAVIIIVVHFFCWIMFYIYIICSLTGQLSSISPQAASNIDYTSRLLGYSNACWNPIIYVLRGKLLRYRREVNKAILSSSRYSGLSFRQKYNTITDFNTIMNKAKDNKVVHANNVHRNNTELPIDGYGELLTQNCYSDGPCI